MPISFLSGCVAAHFSHPREGVVGEHAHGAVVSQSSPLFIAHQRGTGAENPSQRPSPSSSRVTLLHVANREKPEHRRALLCASATTAIFFFAWMITGTLVAGLPIVSGFWIMSIVNPPCSSRALVVVDLVAIWQRRSQVGEEKNCSVRP